MQHSFADRLYDAFVGALAGFGMLLLLAPTLVVLIISFTGEITFEIPAAELVAPLVFRTVSIPGDHRAGAEQPEGGGARVHCSRRFSGPPLRSESRGASSGLPAFSMRSSCHRWVLPAMAFGLSLLLVFNMLGVRLSAATLVLGHTIICVPFVIRMVGASFSSSIRSWSRARSASARASGTRSAVSPYH